MSDIVIEVECLSKQYRLGEVSTGSLGHDLNRWWHRVRGREDPYLSITGENIRTRKVEIRAEGGKRNAENKKSAFSFHSSSLSSDYVWALKDINFEVKRGEVLGIIGCNGAGKSTLLKILSRITAPTAGEIRIDGRIAALLEVGTGFHQDLTGRENIFLNGAILGMTRREIQGKLDEIVDFSGCAAYLDTPVKRYSSGMVVRLGFAVAAHLEPEILIVDEVLAVGDAEFQKKCIGKMKEVASHGRTVLFVSHNLGAVSMLCSRALLLAGGEMKASGPTDEIIARYTAEIREEVQGLSLSGLQNREGDQRVKFHGFSLQREGRIAPAVCGSPLDLVFTLHATQECKEVDPGFSIHDEHDALLSVLYSGYQAQTFSMKAGETRQIVFTWNPLFLAPGTYYVRGRLLADGGRVADRPEAPLGTLHVETGNFYGTGQTGFRGRSVFLLKGKWEMR